MGVISTFAGAAVGALFLLQGLSFLRRPGQHRYLFGLLTIAIAALGALCHLLLAFGNLVLSPELMVVMVEGPIARLALIVILFGVAIGGGLALHTAQVARRRRSASAALTLLGFVIGLLAVTRLRALTPDDPDPVRIYAYDLWWPPLLLWLSLCAGGAVSTLLLSRHVSKHVWTAVVPASVVGVLALERPEFSDPGSRLFWAVCAGILLSGNAAWATRLAYPLFRRRLTPPPRWETRGRVWLPGSVAAAGLAFSTVWLLLPGGWPLRAALWGLWLVWVVWPGLIALSTLAALLLARRAGKAVWPRWRRPTLRQVAAVLAALAVLLSVSDLFVLFLHEPATAFALMLLAWLLLVEAVGGGAEFTASAALAVARRDLAAAGTTLAATARRLAPRAPAPAGAGSLSSTLVKAFVGVVVLIALAELPHSGQTLIEPFGSQKGEPAQADHPDLGALVTARVLNALGTLRREMRPEVLVGRLASSPSDARRTRFVPAETTEVNAALARENDLQLGPVKIPFNLLLGPVQQPVRTLVGTRTVKGVVQRHAHGYSLLASSTDGETWRVSFPRTPREAQDHPASSAPRPPPTPSSPDAIEAVTEMAGELAFEIIAGDPAMSSAGITRSWDAFQLFRTGLVDWERAQSDINALPDAIGHFQQAIRLDEGFALAHYRLGLALQADGQPAQAVEALRNSLRSNPEFAAAAVALAETLLHFESYYQNTPAAAALPAASSGEARQSRFEEARSLLQGVLRLPRVRVSPYDRASAYLGLCSAALDSSEEGRQYLSYFYCKRAEGLLGSLPRAVRQTLAIREAQVAVWNHLAVALDRTSQVEQTDPQRRWNCQASAVRDVGISTRGPEFTRVLWKSAYGRAAQRYYQKALGVAPDDLAVRCNAAVNALARGDPHPMAALERVAVAHVRLGEEFTSKAADADEATAAGYYRLALDSYQAAILLDPTLVEALNGFAYAFWHWRYSWPESRWRPGTAVAEQAERHARAALQAAQGGREIVAVEARSTLGEVLLARARPHEAIDELQRALGLSCPRADSPEDLASAAGHPCPHLRGRDLPVGRWRHSIFDEIRWDLAQAYVCAASSDRRRTAGKGRNEHLYARASALLEQIRGHESERERQPFGDDPKRLDAARVSKVCGSPAPVEDGQEPASAVAFVLEGGKVGYGSHPPCSWLGVVGQMLEDHLDPGSEEQYWLHVWGGGVDRRVQLPADGAEEDVWLAARPRATHDYYFAQLENRGRQALSQAHALETFANEGPSRCSRNLLRLVYVRASGDDGPAGEDPRLR